jgi:hypothetical protein
MGQKMRIARPRNGMGRRALLAAMSLLPFPAVRAQAQTTGAALVIGNSRYQWEAPLPNVRRDAPDMARRFEALGLRTELVQDAGRDAMRQAIDRFTSASRGTNFAAFYFAGHGAAWNKRTYLVPQDADLSAPGSVETLVPAAFPNHAAHRLWVYDNCRNNPSEDRRQTPDAVVSQHGQQDVARNPNSLMLFSTAPGRTALDGPAGQNSPFAAALLRQLEGQSIDLQALAPRLRRDLLIATQGRQVLFDLNSYQQPFLLKGGRGATAPAARSYDPSRIVDLPNAYAFAQENGLPLPPGLIAHRPANNSPDGAKIGSYKYVAGSPAHAQILVVMSVEGKPTAELIISGRNANGPRWRFITGTLSGNKLEFVAAEGARRSVFEWSDANSGALSQGVERPGRKNAPSSTRFSRLDG